MSLRTASRNFKPLIAFASGAAFVALMVFVGNSSPANAQDGAYTPAFTGDKTLKIPEGKIWREWPYVGSLVTPNALNDGEAPFPEHHMIYIDPVSCGFKLLDPA